MNASVDKIRGPLDETGSKHCGRLFLVVGPSGVGKDSIIEGTRAALADKTDIIFPRRVITRPTTADGEQHIPLSEQSFQALERDGAFALSWKAHGFSYGIAAEIEADLASGSSVVVNVSRTVIDQARSLFKPLTVIAISTDTDILAQRLQGRGREQADEIRARLARAQMCSPDGEDVREIDNSGTISQAVVAFCDIINSEMRSRIR
jgi:ribose 1,5-bisphosphokinase